PHCGTSISIHARCSGWDRSLERPSIVVTCLPATRESGATQERMAWPSRWTVQAPHRAMPQPNFVPVNPKESRITQSKGVEGSSSTVTGFPFKKKEVMATSKKSRGYYSPKMSLMQRKGTANNGNVRRLGLGCN